MAIVKHPATLHTASVIKKDSLDCYRYFTWCLKREGISLATKGQLLPTFLPIDASARDAYTWACMKVVSFLPLAVLPMSV